MAKLRIGREILKNALDRAILSDAERATIDRLMANAAELPANQADLVVAALAALVRGGLVKTHGGGSVVDWLPQSVFEGGE